MDIKKWGDKVVWAVDLNEKSLYKLANEKQGYNYLEEPILHSFCEKMGVSIIPFNSEEPKDSNYCHFIKSTYSELDIDKNKNNAIKYVVNYLRGNLRRRHLALKKRAELEKQIEQLKGNSIELRKIGSLYGFDSLYIQDKHAFLIFTINEIIHIPYKIIFLEIIIPLHEKLQIASNSSEITKNLTELKILYHSLKNLEPEKKDNKKRGILVNGQKPNISERYEIAKQIFNVNETLSHLNISMKEKNILLALLMGCSEQTARELFNGTQQKRTPIRKDLVDKYLKQLK